MKRWSLVAGVIGLLLLGYWVVILVQTRRFQSAEQRRFEGGTPAAPAAERPHRLPARGEAFAQLTIPRLGVSVVVLEGSGVPELRRGAGHIERTALPGEGGNFSVAAHRDTFFRPLRFIRLNDVVRVKSDRGEFHYRVVSSAIVGPREARVLDPAGDESLTLVTCYPFDFVGPAPRRFIVRAVRIPDSMANR